MTQTKMLIGSLSSDLYRVATFVGRDSYPTANRFFHEAQKWSEQLAHANVKNHIKKIILEINANKKGVHTLATAEKLLMYSILLQNYALHMEDKANSPV